LAFWSAKIFQFYLQFDMIYVLTAIGLSPGGSTHFYITKIHRKTQITTNVEECVPCTVFASFTTEEKARKNLSQGKKSLVRVQYA
jgi:hypothetical protein